MTATFRIAAAGDIHAREPLRDRIERAFFCTRARDGHLVREPRDHLGVFVGSGRLAGPIGADRPDLVVHGHAHHGSPRGAIGEVPVHNVAVQVTGQNLAFFEL